MPSLSGVAWRCAPPLLGRVHVRPLDRPFIVCGGRVNPPSRGICWRRQSTLHPVQPSLPTCVRSSKMACCSSKLPHLGTIATSLDPFWGQISQFACLPHSMPPQPYPLSSAPAAREGRNNARSAVLRRFSAPCCICNGTFRMYHSCWAPAGDDSFGMPCASAQNGNTMTPIFRFSWLSGVPALTWCSRVVKVAGSPVVLLGCLDGWVPREDGGLLRWGPG